MKAARLKYQGERYHVTKYGQVALLPDGDNGPMVAVETIVADAVLAELKRLRKNRAARERDAAMRDIGMVKVRGALGGTYWE